MRRQGISVSVLVIVAGLAAVAGSALAQQVAGPAAGSSGPASGGSPRLRDRFEAANTTHDGQLTLAQAQDRMPMVARNFGTIDADQKGYVTLGDIRHFMQARRASREGQTAAASSH